MSDLDDKVEWNETLVLLESGEEIVMSKLSGGKYVTLKKELFDNMINEINDSRIMFGDFEKGIDLITITEGGEDENG